MTKIVFLLLALSAGVCFAQSGFPAADYPLAKSDPMRSIIHFENIGVYDIPANELTIGPKCESVRWNNTVDWLGGDVQRRNLLTVIYQKPEGGKWYEIGRGFVAGHGVSFFTRWEGRYLVELRNPDHPIVIEVERKGNSITAKANVVSK